MTLLAEQLDDLAHMPRLPGAACRGANAAIFDQAPGDGHAGGARKAAVAICGACPCLVECRDWVHRLAPDQRPRGVTASEVILTDIRVNRPQLR